MKMELTNQELDARRNRSLNPFINTDFTVMNGKQLCDTCGDQGWGWATACAQFTKKKLDIDLDILYLQAWFSNCIEVSNKCRVMYEEAMKAAAKEDEEKEILDPNTFVAPTD